MQGRVLGVVVGAAVLGLGAVGVAAWAAGSPGPGPVGDGDEVAVAAWSATDAARYAGIEDGSRASRPVPTTTTVPPPPPTTAPPAPPPVAADDGGDGTGDGDGDDDVTGGSGADPDLLADTPPPPTTAFDPYANCPHRWQPDGHGGLIDTGCASEPGPVVTPPTVLPATSAVPPPAGATP